MSEGVRGLLADWLSAECSVASEYSGDITGSYRRLVQEAQGRAESLGIAWDDAIVPEHVADHLRWAEEEDEDE